MKWFKKHWLFVLSILLILPSILPLFRSDFFRMHDYLHVARLIELDVALKDGQFPPRWAPDFGWGFGMPLFHFYPPLSSYLSEAFYLIRIPAVWAIKLVFGLNFIGGFWFMYLWAKQYWGKLGAIVSAVSFVYLPYRAVQFYVRGSLAELTAMTFLPLFFYSIDRLVKTKKTNDVILTAIGFAGVFLSHNVISLLAIFFFPFYLLWKLGAELRKRNKRLVLPVRATILAMASGILGLGLSVFFILPAFFEKQYTVVSSTIAGGFSHYAFHFIYLRQLFDRRWAYGGSVLGPFDNISFQIGWPQVVLAAIAGFTLIVAFRKKQKSLWCQLIWINISLVIAIFMMTFHSQTIWGKLPLLQMAQFPWRLLAFVGTFVAFVSGSVVWLVKNIKLQGIIVCSLVFLTIGLNYSYFKPEKFSPVEDFYYSDRQRIQKEMSDALFDYLPIDAKKQPQFAEKLYQVDIPITNVVSKTGYFSFDANPDESTKFAFNQYYFPGWQVKINGQNTQIDHDNDLGRIEFSIPAGQQSVEIRLNKTKLQQWSDIISLVSWLGISSYLIYLWQKGKHG